MRRALPARRVVEEEQQELIFNMVTPKHILGTFDEALASLRNNVLMMSSLTERSLERAMKGLFDRADDICAHAIADDVEVDELDIQIENDGVAILLRRQPVAC